MSVSVYHCLGSSSFSLTAYSIPGVNQRSAHQQHMCNALGVTYLLCRGLASWTSCNETAI